MKHKLKRFVSGSLAVLLCVSMNINPIGTIASAVVESGIIDEASVIGQNLIRLAGEVSNEVMAAPSSLTPSGIIESSSCECKDYSGVLSVIKDNTASIKDTSSDIKSSVVKIEGYTEELVDVTNSIDATTKAILKDTDYIIRQLGYDPSATGVKPKNVKESFERVSDQIDSLSHEYRVANIKSINNLYAGALWKPKFEDIPNLTEYCEITGGFANTYNGYWNTTLETTVESVLPSEKALEELGYDAILRAEGIIPVGAVVELGEGNDQTSIDLVLPYGDVTGGTGDNVSNEVVVYDETGNLDVVYNDYSQITDSYNVSENIPTSQLIELKQITMPSSNVTYLDAVTLLYKALGEEQVTLEGLYTRNPDIEVESSPLAKQLSGVVDEWEGFDYYVFATRSNPITYEIDGEDIIVKYDYAYWRKAVTSGFVNYTLRDEPISAVDFCTLASKMMIAYGEPELTDNELQTLLQVYGSYYPIQMGDNIALSWAYLKARGIITDDNFPEVYTSNLSRDQLLDMCARIKNPDLRATYKNIQLAITLDEVVVDKGVYPYYDFAINTDGSMFLETTIDYTTLTHYTYLFPMITNGEDSVDLGYGGAGFVYSSTDFTSVVEGAMYNGMVKLDDNTGGHYYYIVQIPKNYKGNAYLRFIDVNEQDRDLGSVSAIELNPKYMIGGIFTQYDFSMVGDKKIATLSDAKENYNWFSFNTQPNNMDIIWYGDAIRCNETEEEPELETAALKTRAVPTFGERLEVAWNNLTAPTTVMAAEDNSKGTMPTALNNWSLAQLTPNSNGDRQFAIVGDGEAADTESYIASSPYIHVGNEDIYYFADKTTEQQRVVDSAALTLIARAKILSAYNIDDTNMRQLVKGYYRTLTNSDQQAEQLYSTEINYAEQHPVSTILNSQNGNNEKYKDLINVALNFNEDSTGPYTGEYLASLYYTASIIDSRISAEPDINLTNANTVSKLKTNDSKDKEMLDLLDELFRYNKGFSCSYLDEDNKFTVKGKTNDVDKFANKLENYLKNDFFLSTGSVVANLDLSTNLESSVLMDRDNHVYIAWNELVKYGIAKSLAGNGLPRLSKTDGVYEFYTNSGVVRVDDINKIIQIGSQIYSFQYESDPPSLVYSNKDGTEIYFDVRCITGVSNSNGYTLDQGRATTRELQIGTGSYAILTLSADGAYNKGSMRTEKVEMRPFADYNTTLNDSAETSNQFINVITSTLYDGAEAENNSAGSGQPTNEPFTYWVESDGTTKISDSIRMTMSSTVPTSNWIFVTNDDGQYFSGKLYVAYLRQAYDEPTVDGQIPEPSQAFVDEWTGELITDALSKIKTKYPDMNFEKNFSANYSGNDWKIQMTKCALANLAADTGTFWTSPQYYWRVFDFTNASCADNYYQTDYTQGELSTDESTSNKPGSVYFLDYLGYIYNIPKMEDFTLKDYYTGKYPLPLAVSSKTSIVNYNMNYYGADSFGNEIPIGVELTDKGYYAYNVNINNATTFTGKSADDYKGKIPFKSSLGDDYVNGTFCAAPSGVFMRYGLYRDDSYDMDIRKISSTTTDINEFYIGTRRVKLSTVSSPNKDMRYWTYASASFGPIAIPANTKAEFCHKYLPNFSDSTVRSSYILQTNAILEPYYKDIGKVTTLGMVTPEVEWNGRAKLVAILDAIDQGTNWWIWVCLTLAPMICVILMTILIGMSFLTELKLWQKFCEKCFDPVRILTFGARDSNTWIWRKVLIPCLITYIAFALLCNANILKIIIYIVDGWMKIMNAL